MSYKKSINLDPHNILIISLSNIGDVVLTLPVIDRLKYDFPEADMTLIIGPKTQSLFEYQSQFKDVLIFHKNQSLWQNIHWIKSLSQKRFDMIVDLRNSAVPLFLAPKYRTSFIDRKEQGHMKDKHLKRLQTVYLFDEQKSVPKFSLSHKGRELNVFKQHMPDVFKKPYFVIAPGAADPAKQWPAEHFAQVADFIAQHHCPVVLIGDKKDIATGKKISDLTEGHMINLCGQTSLLQTACLLDQCIGLLSNDSAPMHLASYLNKPTFAVFGPTNPNKYGPWSDEAKYLQDNQSCEACQNEKNNCKHTCMQNVSAQDVIARMNFQKEKVLWKKH